jgi:hypothetical protein
VSSGCQKTASRFAAFHWRKRWNYAVFCAKRGQKRRKTPASQTETHSGQAGLEETPAPLRHMRRTGAMRRLLLVLGCAYLGSAAVATHVRSPRSVGAAEATVEVFVDPERGDDSNLLAGGGKDAPLHTVHAAQATVRTLLAQHPTADIVVQLLPGAHTVGSEPLVLGPLDGGDSHSEQSVTWRSFDASSPAVLGAPIKVAGWKPHATVKGAFSAPLPANVSKGSPLRHLWVNGKRAERPVGYPACPGGPCKASHATPPKFNLSMGVNTTMYPEGSQYDFAHTGIDPSTWINPTDVEFVFTGCASFNCWVEPRCTVGKVEGSMVSLKQADNSSCFWRLYYFGIGWGGSPEGGGLWRKFPTALENLASNWTQPGQWYYDRAQGSIGYIPRAGESLATLESTATTATAEMILLVNGSKNLRWENVGFEHATWLGTQTQQGFVDTQSAFLYRGNNNPDAGGEPPVNIRVQKSQNISFVGCRFQHLGGVYALGVDGGSQDVIVFNSTFLDISGGGLKLGYSGERGILQPQNNESMPVEEQDRGFLVSDNIFSGIPVEYSGANPIFAAYVADTLIDHNRIHDSSYSGE